MVILIFLMKKQSLPQDRSELGPILHPGPLEGSSHQGPRSALSGLRCVTNLACTGLRELGSCGGGAERETQFKLGVGSGTWALPGLLFSASSCPARADTLSLGGPGACIWSLLQSSDSQP